MRNHFVPRKYLQGFCEVGSNSILWQFDKRTGKYAQVSIGSAGNEKGFYSDAVESMLAELVEEPAKGSIEKLRKHQPIKGKERAQLAMYIATMMKRVPRHREKSRALVPEVLDSTISDVLEMINQAADCGIICPDTQARKIGEVEIVAAKFKEKPPKEVVDQIENPWPTPEMVGLIYSMHWRLLIAEESSVFVTTDNPVFFFEAYGLANEHAELVFPIDNRLALHGCWQPLKKRNEDLLNAPEPLVRELNGRLICSCHRFVYLSRQMDGIFEMTSLTQPQLNRIAW